MFKRLFCSIILIAALCFCPAVAAESEAVFSLSDVSCGEERIFETEFSSNEEVAVFVATFFFDENLLSFREAAATDENAILSVNTSENGKVNVAYLCEEGATGKLLTLKFKSSDSSAVINASVVEAIGTDTQPLSSSTAKGAVVSVISKAADNAKETKATIASSVSQPEAEVSNTPNELYIPGNAPDITLVLCIGGGLVAVLGVATAALLIGKNYSAKNSDNRKT